MLRLAGERRRQKRHGMAWIVPYVCRAEKAKRETNERQEQRVGDRVFHARHA